MCRPLLPEGGDEDDVGFCNRITVEAGVTVLPVRAVACITASEHSLDLIWFI